MSYQTFIVTFIVSIIGFTACDRKKEIKYVEVEKQKQLACERQDDYSIADNRVVQTKTVTFKRKPKITKYLDCSGKVTSEKKETVIEKKQDIKIFADKKIEAISADTILRELNQIQGTAFNRQTCSSAKRDPLSIFGEFMGQMFKKILFVDIWSDLTEDQENELQRGRPSITFTIDMAPALLTTEVDKGVQLIDYEFSYFCADNKLPEETKNIENVEFKGRRWRQHEHKDRDKGIKDPKLCNKIYEQGTLVLSVHYIDSDIPEIDFVRPETCK